jgi:16S rRNA (guanine527-N7)-methyltransferase
VRRLTVGQNKFHPEAYVAEALGTFDKAIRAMGIQVPEAGRLLVEGWLEFFVTWKGRRVAGFDDPCELAVKLLADSFAIGLVEDVCRGGTAVDLGSGNGWPGLVLSAMRRCPQVSLLDSREGACDFLRGFVRSSGIPGVDVVQVRAEEAGRDKLFREKYSLAVSRAMAMPGIVLELCSGLVSVGGKAALWIGPGQEIPQAGPGLALTGMELETEIGYTLPWGMGDRVLAVYKKVKGLGDGYPRRYAAIRKKPLV